MVAMNEPANDDIVNDRLWKKCAGNRWIPGRFTLANGKISFTLIKKEKQTTCEVRSAANVEFQRRHTRLHAFNMCSQCMRSFARSVHSLIIRD
jgi:hypothetical protein